jgi:hypothetical protein
MWWPFITLDAYLIKLQEIAAWANEVLRAFTRVEIFSKKRELLPFGPDV